MHSVTLEMINPLEARRMLDTMGDNRKISDAKVIEYATSMYAGKWSLNGETIKFDKEGKLFDGQHRLEACILADKKFRSFIARGIEDVNAFATVDVGKNRSHGDVFSIAGYVNANYMSGAAQLIYLFQNRQVGWKGPLHGDKIKDADFLPKKSRNNAIINARTISKDALLEFARGIEEDLKRSIRFAENCKAKKLMTLGTLAGIYYLCAEKNLDDARRFFDDLGEGAGLGANDPVLHLRERLNDLKGNKRGGNGTAQRWYTIGLTLKAWNKRRAGETCRSLRVIEGEEFPFRMK